MNLIAMRAAPLLLLMIISLPPPVISQSLATVSKKRVIVSADGGQSIELLLEQHICNNGIGQLYRMHSFSTPIFNSCAEWCLRHTHCSIFDYESRRKSWYCWFYKSTNDCRPQPFAYAEVYVKRTLTSGSLAGSSVKIDDNLEQQASRGLSALSTEPPVMPVTTEEPTTQLLVDDIQFDNDATLEPTPQPTMPSSPELTSGSEEVTEASSEVMVIPLIIESTTLPPPEPVVAPRPNIIVQTTPSFTSSNSNSGKLLSKATTTQPDILLSTFRAAVPSISGRSIMQSPSSSFFDDEEQQGGTPVPSWSLPLLESAIPKIVLNADMFSTTTKSTPSYNFDDVQQQQDESTVFPVSTFNKWEDDEQFSTRTSVVTLPSSSSSSASKQVAHLLLLTTIITLTTEL